MNNRQVAHVWAQQNQQSGRGSNFFFEGPTIYSYGHHFPIARFATAKGSRVVLFTTDGYSSSTAKHKSYVRAALSGVNIFNVPHIEDRADYPRLNFESYRDRVQELTATAGRSRTRADRYLRQAQELASEANLYRELFCPRFNPLPAPELSPDFLAKCREAARVKAARERVEAEARYQALQARLAETVTAWRAGTYHGYIGADDTLLRINGDKIQTSRGAEFPTEHGKLAFRVIARCKAAGEGWRRNGHTIHLGPFVIDEIEPEGNVRAGCHYVKWAEIEACARQLGLLA